MAMYHDNHPNNDYEMANRVELFDPPRAIAWQPGQGADDDNLDFGGWIWCSDWSAVPSDVREHIGFPPFERQHLDNLLKHLAELAVARLEE